MRLSRRKWIKTAAGLVLPAWAAGGATIIIPGPRSNVVASAAEPTISGLTNKWLFTNHSGDTIPDTVGSRDLTNHGGTFVSDGLSLNGTSNYADTAAFSFGSNADISFVIWYKAPASSTAIGTRVYLCKETVNSMFQVFEDGAYTQWLIGGIGRQVTDVSDNHRNGAWHQLIYTRSGTGGVAYMDGNSAFTTTSGSFASFTDSSTVFNVGRYSSFGGGYYCNGTFGLVELYNVALTASNKNDLFAYWRTVFGV